LVEIFDFLKKFSILGLYKFGLHVSLFDELSYKLLLRS